MLGTGLGINDAQLDGGQGGVQVRRTTMFVGLCVRDGTKWRFGCLCTLLLPGRRGYSQASKPFSLMRTREEFPWKAGDFSHPSNPFFGPLMGRRGRGVNDRLARPTARSRAKGKSGGSSRALGWHTGRLLREKKPRSRKGQGKGGRWMTSGDIHQSGRIGRVEAQPRVGGASLSGEQGRQ